MNAITNTTTAFFARAFAKTSFRADEIELASETTQENRPADADGYHPDVRFTYHLGGMSSESLAVTVDLIDAGDGYFDTHIEFLEGNQDWASPAVMLVALAQVLEKFYAEKPWAKYGGLVGMNGEEI